MKSKISNPDNVPNEMLGKGYRFLDESEIGEKNTGGSPLRGIDAWDGDGKWKIGLFYGTSNAISYRTKLTKKQLKQRRGLK
jgi:hypothetical protein